ncbi:hypothetical protein C8255_08875 [filamentous cyanobacterium CCP3]|nr:hypothetical protein C8255_08875 [filamentous cyanobacterium CCP3]
MGLLEDRLYVEVSPQDFNSARNRKVLWGLLSSVKTTDIIVELSLGSEVEDLVDHQDQRTDYRQFVNCSVRLFRDDKEIKLSTEHNRKRRVWILANPDIVFDE